jgi:RimJ/RimL family protein N-acetyltransferase
MLTTDADFLLEMKNYPETRKFAIATHDEIKKEDHYKWLENNIQYFQIIGNRIGAVRIQDNEISIWIDRLYWGQGIASFIIEQVYEENMYARIVDGNVNSMRCFIKA